MIEYNEIGDLGVVNSYQAKEMADFNIQAAMALGWKGKVRINLQGRKALVVKDFGNDRDTTKWGDERTHPDEFWGAVQTFQKANNMTRDGKLNATTWSKLQAAFGYQVKPKRYFLRDNKGGQPAADKPKITPMPPNATTAEVEKWARDNRISLPASPPGWPKAYGSDQKVPGGTMPTPDLTPTATQPVADATAPVAPATAPVAPATEAKWYKKPAILIGGGVVAVAGAIALVVIKRRNRR